MDLKKLKLPSGMGFLIMALLGIAGFTVGMILERYGQFPGCRLCHVERLILLAGGTTSFLAWVWWPYLGGKVLGYLTLGLWALGSCVGFYHAGIQYRFFSVPSFCEVHEAESLAAFLAQPSIPCDQRTLEIFSIPASLYLGFGLLAWAILCGYELRRR